jgi:hypothetical protein
VIGLMALGTAERNEAVGAIGAPMAGLRQWA